MQFNHASFVILPINISTKIDKKIPKVLPFLSTRTTATFKLTSVIIYKTRIQKKKDCAVKKIKDTHRQNQNPEYQHIKYTHFFSTTNASKLYEDRTDSLRQTRRLSVRNCQVIPKK